MGNNSQNVFVNTVTLQQSDIEALTVGMPTSIQPTSGHAGSGFAPGDTGLIAGGNDRERYTVLTTGAGGSVLTLSTTGGAGYIVSSGNTTAPLSGGGSGLQIDILVVSAGTPFVTVPATAGKTTTPAAISAIFNPATTPYTVNNSMGFDFANGVGADEFGTLASQILTFTIPTMATVPFPPDTYSIAPPVGQDVVIHGNNLGVSGGDGTLTIVTVYTVN